MILTVDEDEELSAFEVNDDIADIRRSQKKDQEPVAEIIEEARRYEAPKVGNSG